MRIPVALPLLNASVYLLYWYKSTNTDAEGAAISGHQLARLQPHARAHWAGRNTNIYSTLCIPTFTQLGVERVKHVARLHLVPQLQAKLLA